MSGKNGNEWLVVGCSWTSFDWLLMGEQVERILFGVVVVPLRGVGLAMVCWERTAKTLDCSNYAKPNHYALEYRYVPNKVFRR